MSGDRSAELLTIADRIVAQARPGEQVEAYLSRGTSTEIRVYEGEVEHFVSAQSEGIGIRVIRDGRTGFAYAGTLDESAIAEVLADARDSVQFGTPDEWACMASPDGVDVVEQELWNADLAAFPTDRKIDIAKELERLALGADRRIRVDDANYMDSDGESAVANSAGVRRSGRGNSCAVTVSTLADDGGETQTGFGYSVGKSPHDFDLERAAREGADRATRLLGTTKPSSRRTTVILDPIVASSFLSIIGGTMNGEAVAKGRSIFKDRMGDQIASSIITLVDDPTNPMAYTATDLDGEGLAARRNVLIDDGVLKMFTHNSYSAKRLDARSSGNAVRGGYAGTPGVGCLALQLQPGTRDQAALVAEVGEGVLIQSVQGLHSGVNAISGDFSVGASGMLIDGGAIAAPVREFTIASTLQRMLLDIAEVGNDFEWLPSRACCPSLVIRDVTLSGS
ncbi:MAG: TldD/PmbA family protein [Ilumatobacteraceae bacterium]